VTAPHAMLIALLVALPALLSGCTAEAAGSRTVAADSDDLAMAGMTDGGLWQSAPWSDSAWMELGARATVEVEHGLGSQPASVLVYLSFVEDDRGDTSKRTSFPAAGDVANLHAVTDTTVTIKNTTYGEFYMRLALQ